MFSAGPLPLHVPIILYLCNPSSAFSNPREIIQRFRATGSLSLHAAIGIAVLTIPILLLFTTSSDGFLRFVLFFLSTILSGMIVLSAEQIGVPRLPLCAAAGLMLGVINGLTVNDNAPHAFSCASDSVQLRSGEILACKRLSLLRDGSLWLVEGPPEPRLVGKSDIAGYMVGSAER